MSALTATTIAATSTVTLTVAITYQGNCSMRRESFHSWAQELFDVPLGGWSTRTQVRPRSGCD